MIIQTVTIFAMSLFTTLAAMEKAVFDSSEKRQFLPLTDEEKNTKNGLGTNCYVFKNFIVKTYNPGQKGDDLFVIPRRDAKIPECRKHTMENEIALESWSGSFIGAKDDYAFFAGDDSWNGGFGFAIFDGTTGKKIFEDAYVGRFEKIDLAKETILLQYDRVYDSKCSVIEEPKACLKKIENETGISKIQAQEYVRSAKSLQGKILADLKKRLPDLTEKELRKNHIGGSVIHYPATVKIQNGKAAFFPRKGKVAAEFTI